MTVGFVTPYTDAETPLVEWVKSRGIAGYTLEAWGCTWTGDTLTFPYRGYTKTRIFRDGKKKYDIEPRGVPLCLFKGPERPHATVAVVVEGESDSLCLDQNLTGTDVEVFGLPGLTSWRPEMTENLKGFDAVYFVFDNDQDYNAIAQAKSTWEKIRRDVPRAKRVYLPSGVKDVCEFFRDYDINAFIGLLSRPNYHYRALDFSRRTEPPKWLVPGVFARGDVVLLSGDPGAQKSWLAMSLSQAVVDRRNTWLDYDVLQHGRVLYVDEENPEDVVRERMARLGLSRQSDIRYLLRQGVRLDKEPDKLLDEALDLKPTLIVLDSLVALYDAREENNSGSIRALFQGGIFPLARETGATVLVLHHNNKTSDASPFTKVRGSGDIAGAPDSCYTVGRLDHGRIKVVQFKTRRGQLHAPFTCKVVDLEDGKADMVRIKDKF